MVQSEVAVDGGIAVRKSSTRSESIMLRLREETRPQHVRAEQAVDLPAALASLTAYRALLGRYYGFYAPLEAQLIEAFGAESRHCAGPRLTKHEWLAGDLAALTAGEAIEALPRCHQLPIVRTLADAWGCLYVLEGATLGGQIVRREVQRRFELSGDRGSRFFTAYGEHTGSMWNEFSQALQAYCDGNPESGPAIVSAALQTFECFGAWLQHT